MELTSVFSYFLNGFMVFIQNPFLLLMSFCGLIAGMVVGILPGFGPPAAMALLFPFTYTLSPVVGLCLLAGIFYGAKYGGAITTILMGIPGEPDAVVTLFDGYPLAKAGFATQGLRVSIFSSFFGASFSFLLLLFFAPLLVKAAYIISPFGRLLLLIGASLLIVILNPGHKIQNFLMLFLGLALGAIGLDSIYGQYRLTFNSEFLSQGIPLTPLLLGLFGICDVLDTQCTFQRKNTFLPNKEPKSHIKPLKSTKLFFPALRASFIGFFVGIIPSGAGITASYTAYSLEKKIASKEEVNLFGKGDWRGLVAPEAANNATAMASFAPLLLLGLPTNAVMATLLAALTVVGVVPSPQLPTSQPELYWVFMASLIVGNILLLLLGLFLIKVWALIAKIPYAALYPLILVLCLWAASSDIITQSAAFASVIFSISCGFIAYFLKQYGFSPTPLLFGFILGPKIESHLVQVLMSL